MKATWKVMPVISLCCLMTSEADVGIMVVEAEPSWQYCITFCCCQTNGNRGTFWHKGIWHGSVVYHLISLCGKNGNHWHSLILAKLLWRPNSGYKHSEAMGGGFQQWWQQCQWQVTFWMAMNNSHTMEWRVSWLTHLCKSADYN